MDYIYNYDFVQNVFNRSETENILFSPESTSTLFNVTREGYDQESQRYALRFFTVAADNYLKSFDLYDQKLSKKTKIFIRNEVQLPDQITSDLKNKFGCDVEEIDIKNPNSVNSIKKWIDGNVGDIKSDILENPNINNITKCDFAWHQNIKTNITNNKFKKTVNETLDTEFIDFDGELGYTDLKELDAKIVQVPLANEDLQMLLIVPNQVDGLKNLVNALGGYHLQQHVANIKHYQMKLSIPKVKLQQELNLKDILELTNNELYPFEFKGMKNSCHMGGMKTFTSLMISELGVKAVGVTGCQLLLNPLIKEMIFETSIANRFSKTLITNKVENCETIAQETTFSMVLPEDAFITEFVIEIKGKSYKSYIKEKQEAKDIYDNAVASGRSAAHVAVSARDSNTFTVSVNVEPQTEIKFLLTYEELLQRRYDQYEFVLNIQPGRLVDVLKVEVKIDEKKQPKFVKTPAIRSGNEITNNEETNSLTKIENSGSTVVIRFEPDLENQKAIAKKLGLQEVTGISGQFVVQYDVQLDPSDGEVLISDGYFVHFYVPDDLPPLSKHVTFALDTSGSMGGRKIEQVKDAMKCILDQIRTNDLVDILEFTTNVSVHDIEAGAPIVIDYGNEENYQEPFYKYERLNFPSAKPANREMIEKAKGLVDRMQATQSTHIIGGLETALFLAKRGQEKYTNYQPIIIFLTDGEPNVGVSDTNEITKIVTKINFNNNEVPIFSLSFGEGADKSFLRKLSLANFGFNRHIYEAADASLQLQQFYKQISSPLLSDVNFKYDSSIEDITRTTFPIYFRGSDIIVCGRYANSDALNTVNLYRREGCIQIKPQIKKSVNQIERLWAYLTVKQLLEQRENAEDKTVLTKKALDLALKYSFVTEITSLVVVKPDDSSVVDTENSSSSEQMLSSGFAQSGPPGGNFSMMSCQAGPPMFARTFASAAPMGAPRSRMLSKKAVNSFIASSDSVGLQSSRGMFGIAPPMAPMFHGDSAHSQIPINFCGTTTESCESPEEAEKRSTPTIPTEIIADHPFLMLIQYKLDNAYVPLFMAGITQSV